MCGLFALTANKETRANNWLKAFFARAENAPDGWGLATFGNGGSPEIEKEPENALTSRYLSHRLRASIVAKTVLAHICLASVGAIAYDNCYPFSLQDATGRAWTLIHNGTFFHAPQLNSYSARQRGETDGERALIRLVVKINEETRTSGGALTSDERCQVVEEFVKELSQGNEELFQRNKLNLLIYDGELLYAHRNYSADSLHFKEIDGGLIFATQPFDSEGNWERMPLTRLLAYREGRLEYEGKAHWHVYDDKTS